MDVEICESAKIYDDDNDDDDDDDDDDEFVVGDMVVCKLDRFEMYIVFNEYRFFLR